MLRQSCGGSEAFVSSEMTSVLQPLAVAATSSVSEDHDGTMLTGLGRQHAMIPRLMQRLNLPLSVLYCLVEKLLGNLFFNFFPPKNGENASPLSAHPTLWTTSAKAGENYCSSNQSNFGRVLDRPAPQATCAQFCAQWPLGCVELKDRVKCENPHFYWR